MHSPIRVAVIDACPLFRLGVVHAVARARQLLLVAEGTTAIDAQQALREQNPHIVLVNMSTLEALAANQEIANSRSQCKFVFLTGRDDPPSVAKALADGAAGYILKAVSGAELVEAIETIAAGRPFITPTLASRLLTESRGGPLVPENRRRSAALSYREQQMLDHAAQGLTNQEIAERLGLKVSTIKHYMTRLYKKMKATNRIQAVKGSQRLPSTQPTNRLPNS